MKSLHTRTHYVLCAVLASNVALASAPVQAAREPGVASTEPSEDVSSAGVESSRLRALAKDEFASRNYDAAIALFRQAKDLESHPTDAYNIGRIYEEMGELENALQLYEEFSRQPRLTLQQRAAGAERIEVLRVLVEQAKGDEREPTTPASGRVTRTEPRTGQPTGSDSQPGRPTKPMFIAGGVLLGVGASAAIAGGLGFGLAARRASDKVETISNGSNPERLTLLETEDMHARGRDYEALQVTFLAAGSALAVVGVALLATAEIRRNAATRVSASPALGPGLAGFNVNGRF